MVTQLLGLSLIVLVLALQTGCKFWDKEDDVASEALVLPFSKNPSASVLKSGLAGGPPFIADPGVIKDASGYHLFITNQFCDLNDNGEWDEDEHLFDADNLLLCVASGRGVGATMYAFSDDKGLTWTVRPLPAIEPGPSEWDNFNVETAFPFIHEDTLYILYSAYGDRDGEDFLSRYQIGMASVDLNGRTVKQALLDDAETLVKMGGGTEPLMAGNYTTSDYDNNTQEPSVVVTEKGFELYFTGLRLSKPELDLSTESGNNITGIALMRQKFDFNWVKTGDFEEAYNIEKELSIEDITTASDKFALSPVNIGEVYFYEGRYHIFYTTLESDADFHRGERIAHAVSDDGLTWSNMQLILESQNDESDYDGWGIMAPTVVFENDEAVLFYTAWGNTSNEVCVRSGDGAKWGADVDNASRCVYGNLGRATAALN